MKKYCFFLAISSLFIFACGGPKVVVAPYDPGDPTISKPDSVPALAPEDKPVFDEEDLHGPFLPPEIPPTVYEPYVRRAETTAPPLPPASNSCHLAVEVRNYDGVDGCGILLETDEGNLFLVGVPPRGEPLETGTRISIGFEYMENYEGADCGNADAVIRITCKRLLRVSSGLPRPVMCEAYDKPAEWLLGLARDYSATYITRFPWKEGRYVYLMESPFGQYLYDCRGYLICKPRKNCLGFVEDFSQGVIIFEG
ncbi:hypothetical protein FUA23_03470 [Neolewinella aurantiaca]|uniref:Lipoprotein n=1 Tax=Neolewinella aurantiaca TaxID=2602767 RepID=A0A5C7FWQ6_9BACT|nr:hypothetical protein [Neolewinella aurantiaca]TXF90870.1 hypothetical protein FUA23_03470 [Neolewinella aurantiaca]